jgi:hypothetical protein
VLVRRWQARDLSAPTIVGTVTGGHQHHTSHEVALVLCPNRRDARSCDRRHQPAVVTREQFVAGGITVDEVETRGEPAPAARTCRGPDARDRAGLDTTDWTPGSNRRRRIDPLAFAARRAARAGAALTVRAHFRTTLPSATVSRR